MSGEKVIIDLCSSDEEEDFGDENNCEEEEYTSSSEDDSDWSPDDGTEADVEYETVENGDDDDKVARLLTAGSDLKALNVKECKAYLRKHGLRLSGTKAVFIERIVEHWRIKDGSGDALYPRSSFAINCKGDVCKGDTVLFTQKVHHKYEKMKGTGKIMGRRTVAGQVVKESYGTAKQQHTFTVSLPKIEVLWCEGIQKLPPLYPLLVKGRNLYRLMTLRQRWANEEDRVKVLSEKHSRGAAARKVMRERKIKWKTSKAWSCEEALSSKARQNERDKENQTQRFRQDIPANHSHVALPNQIPSQGHKNPTQSRNMNPPFHSHTYAPRPHAPRPYAPFNVPHSHLPRPRNPPPHSYAYSTQQNQPIQIPPPSFYNGRPTSNALQGQASFSSHANTHAMPITHQRRPYQNHHTRHASSNSGYNYGVRDLDHFSDMMISNRREGDIYRQSENRHTSYHSSSNSDYNHGARDLYMISHRREGDTHGQSRDNYWPNHR